MSEPKTTDPIVAALLREREGYIRAGKTDRVAAVDEQLALRGHKESEGDVPRGRSAAPKQTADDSGKQARPARKPGQETT